MKAPPVFAAAVAPADGACTSDLDQLEENAKALDKPAFTDEELRRTDAIVQQPTA